MPLLRRKKSVLVSPRRMSERPQTSGDVNGIVNINGDGSDAGEVGDPFVDKPVDTLVRANTSVPTISLTSADAEPGLRSASTLGLSSLGLRRATSPSKAASEENSRERSFSLGFKKKEDGPRGRLQFRSNSSSTVASFWGKFRKENKDTKDDNGSRPSTPEESEVESGLTTLMPPPATGFARFRRKTASMLFSSDDDEPQRPPVFRSLSSQSIRADREKVESVSESSSLSQSDTLSRSDTFSRPRSKTLPSGGNSPEKVLDSSKSASYSPRESAEDIRLPPVDNRPAREYMEAVRQLNLKGQTAALLASSDSEFYRNCMAIYMQEFDFTMDPIDMALRKFLMYVVLPKEAQQIDRILDSFATRYHECNPGIYADSELAYVVTFSLMILHTDSFNKHNKHKMQKSDYINNTFAEGVSPDILECFYDNITYTPFVHTDDEPGKLLTASSQKKSSSFNIRSDKNLIDPYALILEDKLDSIRPSLDDALGQECPYSFDAPEEFSAIRRAFSKGASLQLMSSRSRPGAFLSQDTTDNPLMADPGLVEIKVAKIGILFRKEQKRVLSTARSIWKEWGAILTASQLYLFKEPQWIKDLESGQDVISVHDGFHPTLTLSTSGMCALSSCSGSAPSRTSRRVPLLLSAKTLGQEWLAACSETEAEEWTHLINYSAALATHSINPNLGSSSIPDNLRKDIHTSRRLAMAEALRTLSENVKQCESEVDDLLRNARHLKLMAPLQQRTRYHVNYCAARLSAKLDWQWMTLTKYHSYEYVLKRELEEEQQWELRGDDESEDMVSQHECSPVSSSSAVLAGFPRAEGEEEDELEDSEHTFIGFKSPDLKLDLSVGGELRESVNSVNSGDSVNSSAFDHFEECLPLKSGRNSFLSVTTNPDSPSPKDRFYEVRESILRNIDREKPSHRTSSLDLPRRTTRSLSSSHSSGDLRSVKPSLSMRKLRPDRPASPARDSSLERTSSLMRGSDFTLHGKRFSVVEVNPEFAATPNHKRTSSRSEHKQ